MVGKEYFMRQSSEAKPTPHKVNNDSENEDASHPSGNPIRIDIMQENDSATYDKQSSGPHKDITKSFSFSFHLLSLTFQKQSLESFHFVKRIIGVSKHENNQRRT
jgi:hypothetical protein